MESTLGHFSMHICRTKEKIYISWNHNAIRADFTMADRWLKRESYNDSKYKFFAPDIFYIKKIYVIY